VAGNSGGQRKSYSSSFTLPGKLPDPAGGRLPGQAGPVRVQRSRPVYISCAILQLLYFLPPGERKSSGCWVQGFAGGGAFRFSPIYGAASYCTVPLNTVFSTRSACSSDGLIWSGFSLNTMMSANFPGSMVPSVFSANCA